MCSIKAKKYQKILAILTILSLISSTFFSFTSTVIGQTPNLTHDVTTDKEVYQLGNTVNFEGSIMIDASYTDVVIQLIASNRYDESKTVLYENEIDLTADVPVTLNEVNDGENVSWVANKTGEFGLMNPE